MEGDWHAELARREAEHARAEHERSQNAQRFALRQTDERMRAHFLRIAAQAERESIAHLERARRLEARAAS